MRRHNDLNHKAASLDGRTRRIAPSGNAPNKTNAHLLTFNLVKDPNQVPANRRIARNSHITTQKRTERNNITEWPLIHYIEAQVAYRFPITESEFTLLSTFEGILMIDTPRTGHPTPTGQDSLIPDMVTTKELAELIGVPVATLNNWRSIGRGPRSFRLGRAVKYLVADVAAWIEQQQQADDRFQSFNPPNTARTESPSSTPRS